MKYKRPGFELESPIQFPTTITVTLKTPSLINTFELHFSSDDIGEKITVTKHHTSLENLSHVCIYLTPTLRAECDTRSILRGVN